MSFERKNFAVKLGRPWSELSATVLQPSGAAVNLTGATSVFKATDYLGGTVLLSGTEASGIVLGGVAGTAVVTIVDPSALAGNDFVAYDWVIYDTLGNPLLQWAGVLFPEASTL